MLLRYYLKRLIKFPSHYIFLIFVYYSGTSIISSNISIMGTLKMLIAREMSSFGANMIVKRGKRETLKLEDVYKIKEIFWKHNIVGLSPVKIMEGEIISPFQLKNQKFVFVWMKETFKTSGGELIKTGIFDVFPSLKIKRISERNGIILPVSLSHLVDPEKNRFIELIIDGKLLRLPLSGYFSGVDRFFNLILLPFDYYSFFKRGDEIDEIILNVVTVPEDDLSKKSPETMTKREYEKWYCTPYPTSVAKQIEEKLEGADVEILKEKLSVVYRIYRSLYRYLTFSLVLSLFAVTVGVFSVSLSSARAREKEGAIFKMLGAKSADIVFFFGFEVLMIMMISSLLSLPSSVFFLYITGKKIFNNPLLSDFSVLLLSFAFTVFFILLISIFYPLAHLKKINIHFILKKK